MVFIINVVLISGQSETVVFIIQIIQCIIRDQIWETASFAINAGTVSVDRTFRSKILSLATMLFSSKENLCLICTHKVTKNFKQSFLNLTRTSLTSGSCSKRDIVLPPKNRSSSELNNFLSLGSILHNTSYIITSSLIYKLKMLLYSLDTMVCNGWNLKCSNWNSKLALTFLRMYWRKQSICLVPRLMRFLCILWALPTKSVFEFVWK